MLPERSDAAAAAATEFISSVATAAAPVGVWRVAIFQLQHWRVGYIQEGTKLETHTHTHTHTGKEQKSVTFPQHNPNRHLPTMCLNFSAPTQGRSEAPGGYLARTHTHTHT